MVELERANLNEIMFASEAAQQFRSIPSPGKEFVRAVIDQMQNLRLDGAPIIRNTEGRPALYSWPAGNYRILFSFLDPPKPAGNRVLIAGIAYTPSGTGTGPSGI
jgi:hypothetical protein